MAITNYSELQTAVANWLARADMGARIPECIALCEARFNRVLFVAGMEKRAHTITTVTTEYVQLPADFSAARNFQLVTDPVTVLEAMAPEWADKYFGGVPGKPHYYAIVGDEFQLIPPPDAAYQLELDYWANLAALSNTNTTNWALINAPDMYLAGTMVEACYLIQAAPAKIALWEERFQKALKDVQSDSDTRRWPSSGMQMRSSVVIP
jgi:hypothetical protein